MLDISSKHLEEESGEINHTCAGIEPTLMIQWTRSPREGCIMPDQTYNNKEQKSCKRYLNWQTTITC
uniref:Uncharacterized protein n=1 Tax=Anguilla anguilla TaxID=7936 RepID=A0A0E9X1R5_ANGAN